MDLEASQIEDPVYQAPQSANHYGAAGDGGDLQSMLYSLNL